MWVVWLAVLPGLAFAQTQDSNSGKEMKDAFAPAVRPAEKAEPSAGVPAGPVDLHLEALSMGDGKAVAVINGELYREGQEKNGIQVVQIHRRSADILANGISQSLKLYEEAPRAVAGTVTQRAIEPVKTPAFQENAAEAAVEETPAVAEREEVIGEPETVSVPSAGQEPGENRETEQSLSVVPVPETAASPVAATANESVPASAPGEDRDELDTMKDMLEKL